VLALGLHDRRQVLKAAVPEEDRELLADQSLAQVRVPVPVRPERRLRVVDVKEP